MINIPPARIINPSETKKIFFAIFYKTPVFFVHINKNIVANEYFPVSKSINNKLNKVTA